MPLKVIFCFFSQPGKIPTKEEKGTSAPEVSVLGGFSLRFYIECPEGFCRLKQKFNFNAEPPWEPS